MPERGQQRRRIARVDRARRLRPRELQLLCSMFPVADPEEQIAEVEADDGGLWKTFDERAELREGAGGVVLRETADGGSGSIVIMLADQADVSAASEIKDQDARGWFVYNTLREHAERTQPAEVLRTTDLPFSL